MRLTQSNSRHHRWLWRLVFLGIMASGCSSYHSKPLGQVPPGPGSGPPSMDSVRVAAAKLQHPLLAPIVIDGNGGYTPEEIAVMVVVVSPDLRALRDRRGVAEAQVVQAGILPNPQIGYSIDWPHGTYDPAVVAAHGLSLSWEVTSLLSHRDQVASAKAGASAIDLSVAWQEWQTAQDARLRAYRILSLERRIPLSLSVEGELADTLSLTRKAVALGLRTNTDLTTAAEAWSQAQDSRFELEKELSSERAALNLALGMPPGERVPLKVAGLHPNPEPDAVPDAAPLLEDIEKRRLDLVALRFGYESQEASLRAAVMAQFPKIGISVNKANDTTPIYTRGAGVTMDLPLFDRNQGQIALGEATRQQLFDEYAARVAEARSQVVEVLGNLAIANRQLSTVDDSIPGLEHLVASYESARKSGNADEFAYRDAQGALATRRIEQELLRQQVLELDVALEIATGRPSLGRGDSPANL